MRIEDIKSIVSTPDGGWEIVNKAGKVFRTHGKQKVIKQWVETKGNIQPIPLTPLGQANLQRVKDMKFNFTIKGVKPV